MSDSDGGSPTGGQATPHFRASVLVLKFGGTSVGTPRRVRLAARRIAAHVGRGRRVVAVVSAAVQALHAAAVDVLRVHQQQLRIKRAHGREGGIHL